MEIIEKKNTMDKIFNYIKNNSKIIILFCLIILLFIAFSQYYFYSKNNKILETSIKYDSLFSNESSPDFKRSLDLISKEKNFYGVLASLEKINLFLEKNEIEDSYNLYLKILKKKDLANIHKSIIAIQASYSLLDKIKDNNNSDIFSKIENLVTYVDTNYESFVGFKLEILYLISINNFSKENKKSIDLYNRIQLNDNISSSIKERVKKIHEFETYK